jgi:hypothetical protein
LLYTTSPGQNPAFFYLTAAPKIIQKINPKTIPGFPTLWFNKNAPTMRPKIRIRSARQPQTINR